MSNRNFSESTKLFDLSEISSEELLLINASLLTTLRWNRNPRVRSVIRELLSYLTPFVEEAYDDLMIVVDDDDDDDNLSDLDDLPF